MEDHGQKRASAGDGGPPEKRLKGEAEDTTIYSEKVKKKLQANSRTGQACDRCKERKMKCDPGQDGCQPCKSRDFRCVATDRITGQVYERGETGRLKKEVEQLRAQVEDLKAHLNSYFHHFGALPSGYPLQTPYQTYSPQNGYTSNPPHASQMSLAEQHAGSHAMRPSNEDGPYKGPIHETNIDFVDGQIDLGAFASPDMVETLKISDAILPFENLRRNSLATILGEKRSEKPQMPSRDDALSCVDNYQKVIAPYVPILHGPTFRKQVADFYDHPLSFDAKPAEVVTIMLVLAIFAYQMAIRNPPMRQEKLAESNRLYRYGLSFYPELLLGNSLANMQALSLILVHARNLPKPGNSWSLSSMILSRAVELNYHRSSSKIVLPPEERNELAIELRKRVFWSILGMQVTIAVKMGRPMAISPRDMDVELPQAVLDAETTANGIPSRSGQCDFWGHIFLSKKLPLLMRLYENVIVVRKSAAEYCREIEELDAHITNWRHEWDQDTKHQTRNGSYQIATHLIDLWYAEFRLILHHPKLCTSQVAEVQEKNLDKCLEASRTMLRNVMSMISHFKGPDFTWHFVSGYVLGMGMTLHVHNKRREQQTPDTFNKMKNELNNWMHVMRNADHFMKSGDGLVKFFTPLVEQCIEEARNVITASEALRNGFHHNHNHHNVPQSQPPEPPTQPTYSAPEPYHQAPTSYNTQPPQQAAPPPPPQPTPTTSQYDHISFIPAAATYSRSMYPATMAYPAADTFPTTADMSYSVPTAGMWPAGILQFQNSGM